MCKVFKFTLPWVMFGLIGVVGCGEGGSDESATTVTELAPTAPAPAEANANAAGASDSGDQAAEVPAKPQKTPAERLKEQIAEQMKPENLGPNLEKGISQVYETIEGITDQESALAARKPLQDVSRMLGVVSAMSSMVPPESQEMIYAKVSEHYEPMKAKVDQMLENEQIEQNVGSVVTLIVTQLDRLMEQFDPEVAAKKAEAAAAAEAAAEAEATAEQTEPAAE